MNKKIRSGLTAGRKIFLPDVVERLKADGRSVIARRYVDLFDAFRRDQGGDGLSEARRQLARRAALLAVQLEVAETRYVASEGESFNSEGYIAATRELRLIVATMGLNCGQRPVGGGRLSEIVEASR